MGICCVGVACASQVPPDSPAESAQPFGGERARFGETGAGESLVAGVGSCQGRPALASDPQLDDFEQDSVFISAAPQRWGAWYMANDGSAAGRQVPESYGVERGGRAGSNHALHFQSSGYTQWGAMVGFALRDQSAEGIRCPFNARAFGGIAFFAKGKGRVRVQLNTPETTPREQEGRCTEGCWDSHGAYVYLNDDWTEHRIAWSRFAQNGWGHIVRLDVGELLAINFHAGQRDQPVELWLDDVRFMSPEEVAAPLAAVPPAAETSAAPPKAAPSAAAASSEAAPKLSR